MDQAYVKVTLRQGFQNISAHILYTSMPIEEYQIIFATLQNLKNQRRPVLSMELKHQGCPI